MLSYLYLIFQGPSINIVYAFRISPSELHVQFAETYLDYINKLACFFLAVRCYDNNFCIHKWRRYYLRVPRLE
jgi:hypothetical protein